MIHSIGWTGSSVEQALPGRATPSYAATALPVTPYYQQIERRAFLASLAPGAFGVMRWQIFALFAGPQSLWLALAFTRTVIRDYSISLNSNWLIQAAIVSAGLTAMQMAMPVRRSVVLRKAAAIAVLLATFTFAFWYSKTALEAHAAAHYSQPERIFLLAGYEGSARSRKLVYYFQRSNGTMVDGSPSRPPPASGAICGEVQRLDGKYGFSWVRLRDRSRPPEHEITWPIRATDCFSDKPLSSLQG